MTNLQTIRLFQDMTTTTSSVHSVKNVLGGDRVPEQYEAYMYRYTVKDPSGPDGLIDRWYVGVHHGFIEDGYHHSSSDAEFDEIFSNADANITLEYLAFGDYEEMTAKEHRLLKETNARENKQSFNKSYGSPQVHLIDNEICIDLARRIENGDFLNEVNVNIEELFELKRLQVREQDDDKHIKEIRNRIDDAGGSTAECDPVTILQERGPNNTDVVMDGNHTIAAAKAATRATTLRRNLIPKDVHNQFRDAEIRQAALLLNPVQKKIKKSSEVADMVKHVVGQYDRLGPKHWDTTNTRTFLKEVGFAGRKITEIMNKARDQIADLEDQRINNMIWKNYKTDRFAPELEEAILKHTNDDTVVIASSSGAFDWRKIADNWRKYKDGQNVVILLYHPTRGYKAKWDKGLGEFENKLDYFLRQHGTDVTIFEMETQCVNEIETNEELVA